METEVILLCQPYVLMNTQLCYPSYSKEDLAGGGKRSSEFYQAIGQAVWDSSEIKQWCWKFS